MNSKVRLLPVLAAVALGAFAVKAVSIAEAAGDAAAKSSAQSESAGQKPSSGPAPADIPTGSAGTSQSTPSENEQFPEDNCATPDFLAEQAGLSQYEIQVLRSLATRRDELDTREASLDTREMAVSAAELRLNDQIDELKKLESSIQSLLQTLDDKNQEQLLSLVKVYETMKPKDAARIFNTLDDELMLSLADLMKPASMAAILSEMSPDRARTLTQLMAMITEPPETLAELEARTNGP